MWMQLTPVQYTYTYSYKPTQVVQLLSPVKRNWEQMYQTSDSFNNL